MNNCAFSATWLAADNNEGHGCATRPFPALLPMRKIHSILLYIDVTVLLTSSFAYDSEVYRSRWCALLTQHAHWQAEFDIEEAVHVRCAQFVRMRAYVDLTLLLTDINAMSLLY